MNYKKVLNLSICSLDTLVALTLENVNQPSIKSINKKMRRADFLTSQIYVFFQENVEAYIYLCVFFFIFILMVLRPF